MLKNKVDKQVIMVCKYDNRDHIKRWEPLFVSNRPQPDTITNIGGFN